MGKVFDYLVKLLLDSYPGFGTYVTGIGLVGLGLYQISQGDATTGIATVLLGLAALRGRRAIERLQKK